MNDKQPVLTDPENGVLYVSHIGFTLRVLLAAAANAGTNRRTWKISYKGVIIGSIRIKDNGFQDQF